MGNPLQSRRDNMFIALCSTNLFSPVGTICYGLVISSLVSTYRPYGTKKSVYAVFYKHIVPTGLKYWTVRIVMLIQKGFLEQEIFS